MPGEAEPEYLPVSLLTRRPYAGEMIEVRTKMGRRLRTTADHPFIVGDGQDDEVLTLKAAEHLDTTDWVPLALGGPSGFAPELMPVGAVLDERVLVRPERREIDVLSSVEHRRGTARLHDIRRTGTLRLTEACAAGMDLEGATVGTVGERRVEPDELRDRRALLARRRPVSRRGPLLADTQRIHWAFHPEREQHLVDEVVSFWQRHGIKVRTSRTATARTVTVSSRIVASWWRHVLGVGRTSYTQRIPDLAWEQTLERKRALLSGLWEGDGSWSLVNGGPSVILEWGTISDELAEGVARLLADVGLLCAWRRGRTAKSTKETHWLRVSGADQVERAMFLVPERDRTGVEAAIARQAKRIAPTGYRRFDGRHAVGAGRRRAARALRRSGVLARGARVAHASSRTTGSRFTSAFPRM